MLTSSRFVAGAISLQPFVFPTIDLQSLLLASLHLCRHRLDLQPLLHSTSCRSTCNLQSLNLQPLLHFLGPTLNLHPTLNLKPLLPFLGPTLDLQPLQPLLAFLGPTLNQQPLPPPALHLQPLVLPTQFWLQSWRR